MAEANEQNPNLNETEGKDGGEDVAGLKSALQAERDARKAAEKSAKDLKTRLESIESSGKTESEKIAARLKALEDDNAAKSQAIRERDARDAVRSEARKLGASDASLDAIYRMVKGDVAFDDDGKPNNLKDILDDAKQIAPQLFRATNRPGDGGHGNRTTKPAEGMNELIRRAAGVST